MNFEHQASTRKTVEEKAIEENVMFEKKLITFFTEIFEYSSNQEERFNEFERKLKGFWDIANDEGGLNQEYANLIKDSFKTCCQLDNKEEFIKQGIVSLKPLIDWRKDNEVLFETRYRKNFIETTGFIPLNEMLSYGRHKNNIHIHVAPSKTLSIGTKISLLKDGFRNLQKIVEGDKTIQKITASSWIVATKQGRNIMENLGFTVEGEISDELREKFFKSEERPVANAFISRKDFLKSDRY